MLAVIDESEDFRLFGVKLREFHANNLVEILARARLRSKQKEKRGQDFSSWDLRNQGLRIMKLRI